MTYAKAGLVESTVPARLGQVFTLLLGFEVFLIGMYWLMTVTGSWTLSRWFDLDAELTVASWFAASQLLAVGLLMLAASPFSERKNWPTPLFCQIVGLGFVFLSMDEAAMIHERITAIGRDQAWVPRFNDTHGSWIFLYALIGAALAAFTWRNLMTMLVHHRQTALLMGGGFALLVAGAVGVEVMGYYGLFGSPPLQVALEEFLEMLGVTVMLMGALTFFNRTVALRPAD
ncbi:hypothetical protein [Indioceanicola profundi]|uniref:hypothetical protein n=1 Tax=Indioceanicola profundi TaxID=2220096 RepID=UPI000E6A9624|nr:hypothetical protein [Indioceanicola profundi]